MLNVALVGLLAGSLAIGGGDNKNPQAGDKPAPDNAVPGIFTSSTPAPLSPSLTPRTIQDTYALGIADRNSPIRLWANYAQGKTDGYYGPDGNTVDDVSIAGSTGEVKTRRAAFGGELGLPVGLFGFGIGVGGQLTLAENKFEAQTTGALGVGDIDSKFGLQNGKVYATAAAGPIKIHGGYIFDLGDNREYAPATLQAAQTVQTPGGAVTIPAGTPLFTNGTQVLPQPLVGGRAGFAALQLPTALSNSDGRDAIFFGADFDYPIVGLRTFGAVDYYLLQKSGPDNPNTPGINESDEDGDDIINAMFGAGVKLSILEIGAALQVQTRLSNPIVGDIGTSTGIGGHAVTVAPYLRLSPPQIPASIFIKGAVQEEYTEFGYRIAGANSPRPGFGFTAGLSVGFQ